MKRLMPVMALAVAACAPMAVDGLPSRMDGKVEVLAPDDPAYAQANVGQAVKPAGQGGVSRALVVRLNQDLPVYRLWNGPQLSGRSNRLGGWWAFDKPSGTREGYRRAYEICGTWNQLTWVAVCTLKKGAVVAMGPGQSVSAATCQDSSGYETYDPNARDWQVYVDQPWNRPDALSCPPEDQDKPADVADVGKNLN